MRAIPLIAAVVSTSLLAYFLLSERSQPQAQLQQPEAQQLGAPSAGQQGASSARQGMHEDGQQVAQGGPQQQQPQAQPEPVQRLPMPNDDSLVMMILSSVVALNQANATGNYTVLRAMAAPGFQQANSAARLAELFANLRGRNLDLTPILMFQPKLYRKPEMNAKGMLRITGFFPTAPERVNFDLIFQPVQGQWRLYGIAVDTSRPQPAPSQAGPGPGAPSAGEPTMPGTEPKLSKAPPPAPKPKPKAKVNEAPDEPVASSSDVDIRNRLDRPASPPPAEKPKPKGLWNPFGG